MGSCKSGGKGGASGGAKSQTPTQAQSIKPTSQNKVNVNATAKKTKLTKTQISNLSRAKMESLAKDIYIKKAMSQGLSQSEADYRFRSLISSNGKTALIKYIYKNQ